MKTFHQPRRCCDDFADGDGHSGASIPRRRSRYESWQMDKLAAGGGEPQKWPSQLHLNVPLNRRFRSTSSSGNRGDNNCSSSRFLMANESSLQQDRWADLLFANSNQNVAIWNRSARCIVCVSKSNYLILLNITICSNVFFVFV